MLTGLCFKLFRKITSTNAFTNFQTQLLGSTQLSKGNHIVKIYADKGGFNLKQIILIQ